MDGAEDSRPDPDDQTGMEDDARALERSRIGIIKSLVEKIRALIASPIC
jgi:hypothetical protein